MEGERYLHSQRERVPQDQHKHDVLKLAGVDDFPELELGLVFRDVNLYGLSFKRVVDTLALEGTEESRQDSRRDAPKRKKY